MTFAGVPGPHFADQQVHMFGHNYVADQRKPIPRANLAENLHRYVSRAHAAQQSSSLIAAKCDEMQMAKPGDASQTCRHSERPRAAHPLQNPQRVGHPGCRSIITFR